MLDGSPWSTWDSGGPEKRLFHLSLLPGHITASALALGVCEVLYVPFERGMSLSCISLALLCAVLLAFKARHTGHSSPQCETPRLGS